MASISTDPLVSHNQNFLWVASRGIGSIGLSRDPAPRTSNNGVQVSRFEAAVYFSWRSSCSVVAAPTGARPTEVGLAVGVHTVGVVDFPTASSLPLFLAPVFVSPAFSSHLRVTVPLL